MKIVVVYPDWRVLRERSDDALCRLSEDHKAEDDYMAVTMKGEDRSQKHSDLYEIVCNEEIVFDDPTLTDHQILERLFEQFNIGDHGGRSDIRSMSVGDQVSLAGRCYICKPCGWERLWVQTADNT